MNAKNLQFEYPQFIYRAFFNNDKYSIIKAGRRTGKTYNAAQWILESLLSEPGKAGLWVDTTQTNLTHYVERYFQKILAPIWSYCEFNRSKLLLKLPNNSYLDLRSAERPESMEGFEYDYIVLNEAGIILRSPRLWHNTIQPMAKNALCKVIGTPKGKNLFHKLYHLDTLEYGQYSYSCYDSPYWSELQLNGIKASIPSEVWQQEYMAEFLEGHSAVFRNIERCIVPETIEGEHRGPYLMGIDLAKHQDYTVIYIAEQKTRRVIFQDRFQGVDWSLQKARIHALWQRYGRPVAVIDSTGVGDPIYDDLRVRGMHNLHGYKFTGPSKTELIQKLIIAIENQAIKFPRYKELINELELFEYQVSSGGHFRYAAPEGYHDDCVIALALVNYAFELVNNMPNIRIINL